MSGMQGAFVQDDDPTIPVASLPYEGMLDPRAVEWLSIVRMIGVATIALCGVYLLSGLFFIGYYVTVARFSANPFRIVPVLLTPIYVLPILAGVNCLRHPPRRWGALRRALILLVCLRILSVASDWVYLLLAFTQYANNVANFAAGARLGQTLSGVVADLILPIVLLWLATRPAVRAAFAQPTP